MNIVKVKISCFIDAMIYFFASLACPTWGLTQEDKDKMMIKKGYITFIMPDDILRLDEEY